METLGGSQEILWIQPAAVMKASPLHSPHMQRDKRETNRSLKAWEWQHQKFREHLPYIDLYLETDGKLGWLARKRSPFSAGCP